MSPKAAEGRKKKSIRKYPKSIILQPINSDPFTFCSSYCGWSLNSCTLHCTVGYLMLEGKWQICPSRQSLYHKASCLNNVFRVTFIYSTIYNLSVQSLEIYTATSLDLLHFNSYVEVKKRNLTKLRDTKTKEEPEAVTVFFKHYCLLSQNRETETGDTSRSSFSAETLGSALKTE